MAKKAEMTERKVETVSKPELRRRGEWFDFPDVLRLELPDVSRWFDRAGPAGRMRIEEEMKDDSIVIRAEIPGIDPDKDVEITVADDVLTIKAARRQEFKEEDEGRIRSEFRYGEYRRSLVLPKGAAANDIKAIYKDGILEVTVPVETRSSEQQKVAIARG
jgi:HSP20 family protein